MSCWITGGGCLYDFNKGILGAKMSFCKDCAKFLLNDEEIKVALDDLEMCENNFLSLEIQEEIWEYSSFVRDLISRRLISFMDKKKVGKKLSDSEGHEEDVLKFLDDIFKKM